MAFVSPYSLPRINVLDGALRDDIRRRLYSAARVFHSLYRQSIVVDVKHAGESRRIEVSVVSAAPHEALRAGYQQAVETLDYLDDLRQGMRDLVDQ